MPPRNAPLPNAVNLFNCSICDKGYPRQVDYENHLRSYDHNHRQRLAEMKKLTAANESERPSKTPLDMRSIPIEQAGKKPGLGPRFTKIGGTGTAAGGGRFKKVGVAVSGNANNYEAKATSEPAKVDSQKEVNKDNTSKIDTSPFEVESKGPVTDAVSEKQEESKKDEDVVMGEGDEDEAITWEEYDFTKPTGCDHAQCPGCKTTGIFDNGWVVLGAA